MEPPSNAWEQEYIRRGKIWAGSVHDLPLLPAGSLVLELGCGNGKTLFAMARYGWNIVAIDFSHRAASLGKKALGNVSLADISISDARHLPFCNGSFDAVVAYHVIGHNLSHERKLVVAEAFRVLKPGGVLAFRDFSSGDFRFGTGSELETGTFRRGTGIQTHYYTEDETRSLLSAFHLVSLRTDTWRMRVRGHDLIRAEIAAIATR
jgi:ubiquinone/menaquinone biosynthesis C-methylase UbiE